MLFNSFTFLIFLAIVLPAVAVARRFSYRAENWVLVAASCVFYGWWDWRFLGLLLFTSAVDFLAGREIGRSATAHRKKLFLLCSLGTNLAVLGFFKYCNFFEANLAHLLKPLGVAMPERLLDVVLPVGVSFYTFQAMSYTIDVYRGRVEACKHPREFLTYITFFPQLVAGPIERAGEMLPQYLRGRHVTREDIAEGFYLILWGYAKKTVVADNLGLKVDHIFNQATFTTADVIVGTLGFAFQVYADFSGYTDIARGVARWLGIRLCLNFDHPYFSRNPREFWQRWHISLSTWLREYLYIPLGGNRLGEGRTYANLMITMLLGGLWHGAAWNFVLWGGYQGGLLAAHRWYGQGPRAALKGALAGRAPGWILRGASMALMFCFTLYGWLLFRAHGAEQLAATHSALLHWHLPGDMPGRIAKLLPYVGLVGAVDTVTYRTGDPFFFARQPAWVAALFYLFLLYTIIILGMTGGERFIYFAF
jgi:D-alanyl-lipoteichoic acid acyltransferase DltB (MBOAT superfamily)